MKMKLFVFSVICVFWFHCNMTSCIFSIISMSKVEKKKESQGFVNDWLFIHNMAKSGHLTITLMCFWKH